MSSHSFRSRLRKHRPQTERGQELYEKNVEKYSTALREIQCEIEALIEAVRQREYPLTELQSELSSKLELYQKTSTGFSEYLESVRTEQGNIEKITNAFILRSVETKVEAILSEMYTSVHMKETSDKVYHLDGHVDNTATDTRARNSKPPSIHSHVSSSSRKAKSKTSKHSLHSKLSKVPSVNSLYLAQKTKVEEARVRLDYVKQEAKLLKQRADIDASIKVLNTKRELEEYEKGLEVLDDCFDTGENDSNLEDSDLLETQSDRVREYVSQIGAMPKTLERPIGLDPVLDVTPDIGLDNQIRTNLPQPHIHPLEHIKTSTPQHDVRLSANTPPFVPKIGNANEEMAKFIVKKDLLLSRIQKFNDKPEFFGSWKKSFKDTANELGLSPSEEVDLLVKWLGPESSKSALSIRSSNYMDPARARDRIWERLHDRYARPEMVEASIKQKLLAFPKISNKDNRRLYDLVDIVSEIESIKVNEQFKALFAYFDSSAGVNPIVSKLPQYLQGKWTTEANKFKENNNASFPPLEVFANFLRRMAKLKNDPSFIYEDYKTKPVDSSTVTTRKTELSQSRDFVSNPKTNDSVFTSKTQAPICPLHKTNHTLNKCNQFRQKPLEERISFLRSKGLCFKCCGQKGHLSKDCRTSVTCTICKATDHPSALHVDNGTSETMQPVNSFSSKTYKSAPQSSQQTQVNASCTKICKDSSGTSKSCAKTVLVKVYPTGQPEQALLLYAIIDEQSNRSLARSTFFEHFGINGPDIPYTISSCTGSSTECGRRVSNFIVESLDGGCKMNLPTLIECDQIPNVREEIPSSIVAKGHAHLKHLCSVIPDINDDAEILILIGRDLLQAHHVLDQHLGPPNLPYAQKLNLGWVIIGESCLGATHQKDSISVMKTFTLKNGRTTQLEPCFSNLHARDNDIFTKTKEDDVPGLSQEDKEFLHLMESETYKNSDGLWTAPLPFRKNRQRLPDNKQQALKRARLLDASLKRNPQKESHVVDFMNRILSNGHAEAAPPLDNHSECWYLPLFAVYHPKKPGSVRCVFDSSAKYEGVSLNDVLLSGPDLVNSLLGILMRFRQYSTAVTVDIEQMFYCFSVPPEHRNFLRFLWYRDNNPKNELTEYRMTRHVFGNSPSPAVATFALRKSVSGNDQDVRDFVGKNFYVDDGLMSFDTSEEAVSLLRRTQKALKDGGNIRLHKISSNDLEVLKSFPVEDLSKDIKGVDLNLSQAPLQRSLGVSWDISEDCFTFQVSTTSRPFTKRGVLATINSLYDPLGFVAPVIVRGKLILRDVMSSVTDWDEPLPEEFSLKWREWEASLAKLETVTLPRCYVHLPSSEITRREIHVFSDASQKAIGAVAYLKLYDVNGGHHVSFIHGKAKVAPTHGHTIPRLELCAAVLAVNLKDIVMKHLTFDIDSVVMYTDSQVVLGYINNDQRRFYIYVGNRVDIIRQSTAPEQWTYIPSEHNPADNATRSISAGDISKSAWLQGPSILIDNEMASRAKEQFPLISPDDDKEIRPSVVVSKNVCSSPLESIGTHRFERFSNWSCLVRAIARLQHIVRSYRQKDSCKGWHMCSVASDQFQEAELFILKQVHLECFPKEITALMEGRDIPRSSYIISLSPILDGNGVLRVGGRLNYCKTPVGMDANPIIVPKRHHVARLLVRHYHEIVYHQGRHLTEGKIRTAGFWIIGSKNLVTSHIHQCVVCRKLRGRFGSQIMSDLPQDRLTPSPPFTFVGVDTFGPWNIVSRRTRGGQANKKRWAILFTCLVCRAVHIEVVEELSSSSFINAMRRFIAVRGPVRQFRSDRGTNFVGAVEDMNIKSVFVEDEPVRKFLNSNQATWVFNPPHASHFGGSWERMIGTSRRILDAMLLRTGSKGLTHEVLTTFMSEVCSIINSRPIIPVSTDPSDSAVLSPSALLTQKVGNLPENLPEVSTKDVYRAQWKHVLALAQEFWKRWREQFLSTIQSRRKWTTPQQNFEEGDIVLLKDHEVKRNHWPMAIVEKTFPSADNRVRKVQIRVSKDRKQYVRPICELVPLVSI